MAYGLCIAYGLLRPIMAYYGLLWPMAYYGLWPIMAYGLSWPMAYHGLWPVAPSLQPLAYSR